MKKEQLSADVLLYHGDSREIIPTLPRIDACITDPPYGIEDMVGAYGRGAKTIANDKSLDVCAAVLNALVKHQKTLWVAAFYSCRISPVFFEVTKKLDYFGEIVWDKKVFGMGTQIRYQHENIGFFKIGDPAKLDSCGSVLTYHLDARNSKNKGDSHPHEKPVQVMHNLCRIVPGQTILDPFMGSGSTGVAAVQLKRKFIGIELDKKWFDVACKRIGDAMKQDRLFT
jgi:site-specific DNA-methyltransferase (adenine-specific)